MCTLQHKIHEWTTTASDKKTYPYEIHHKFSHICGRAFDTPRSCASTGMPSIPGHILAGTRR